MPNEKSQIAVAVILKELDLPMRVGSKRDRLIMQKGIYLSQIAGANLGYWFNWYINGPYSPALADDYYEAQSKVALLAGYRASDGLREKLAPVKKLIMEKPEEAELVDWMEALASLDYMQRVQHKAPNVVIEACLKEKPHLKEVLPAAFSTLSSAFAR